MRYVERPRVHRHTPAGGGFGLICLVVRSPGSEHFRVMSNMENMEERKMRYVE